MQRNPVGWFEIYVKDMASARRFYETVLAVKLSPLPMPGGIDAEMVAFPMEMGAAGAAGALVKMDGFSPGAGGTMVYFSCEDCAVESGRVVAAGGRIKEEKSSIGEYGFAAAAFDPEGNVFGLHSMK